MKIKALHLLAILLFTIAACRPCKEDTVSAFSSYPVGQNIFGFNTGSTFYLVNPSRIGSQEIASYWLDSLLPRSLRFPGGRDANFYHHNAKAYGFKMDEFETGSSDEDAAALIEQQVFAQEAAFPDGINVKEPFAEMANRQSQVSSIFTVNILHAGYEENRDALNWLLQHQVAIGGIELGNETYLSIHQDIFPTAADYIVKAKDWAARFRVDFPGLKIGVVGAPVRADQTYGADYVKWNEALSQEDFFDAVCWHHYVKFALCGDEKLSDATWNCLRDSMVRETQERLPVILNHWQEQFPGKKLWLTEWNLAKLRKDYISSQAANLYYSTYLLQMARFSAENDGFIEFAHHHNLLGNGLMAIMSADFANPVKLDKCVRQPGFLSFAYLRDLFDGNCRILQGDPLFRYNPSFPSPIDASFLHTQSDGKTALLVVLVNPSEQAQVLQWNQKHLSFKVDGQAYQADIQGKTLGFKGASLKSGQGGETELDRIEADFAGNLNVPGYSVQVVRVLLEEG